MPPSNKKKSRPASDKKSAARNSSGRATGKGPKVSKEGSAKSFSAKRPTKSASDKPSRATRKRETAGIPEKSTAGKRGGAFKKDNSRFDKPAGEGKTFSSKRPTKSFGEKPSRPYRDNNAEGSGEKSFGSKRGGAFKKDNSRFDKPSGEGKTFSSKRPTKSFGEKPSRPYRDNNAEGSAEKSSGRTRGSDFKKDNSRFDKPAGEGKKFSSKRPTKSFGEKPSRPYRDNNAEASGEKSFRSKTSTGFKKEEQGADKPPRENKSLASTRPPKSFDDRASRPRKNKDFDGNAANSVEKNSNSDFSSPSPKKKSAKTEATIDGQIRLNRYISNSGLCSRRDADDLIAQGLISVNGKVEVELGLKVFPHDIVKYEGRTLKPERMAYVLLNKPKDFITTMDDPEDRKTVMDLVKNACKERVYPVGRLDRNTTGLLLLTNDGELAEKLTHPSHQIGKIYQVDLDRPITDADMDKISAGVHLEDGVVHVKDIAIVSPDKKILGVEITEGRNRVVRRLFEALGYDVVRLDRVSYAGLTKKDLPRGTWRLVTEKEVARLKQSIRM